MYVVVNVVIMNKFKNKYWKSKIAILWFGKEWKSTLGFLKREWIKSDFITILDMTNHNLDSAEKTIFGDNYLDNLAEYDVIIKAPGISSYHDKILPFKDKLLSQTQIFFDYYKWNVISVSATKWKSTIVSLIFQVLKNAWYNVKLCGNIWNPVLDEIDLDWKYDFVVYELSSYMLDWLKKQDYISILWNIYPDHLDWHHWYENYQQAKLNVLQGSKYSFINCISKCMVTTNAIVSYFGHVGNYTYQDGIFFVEWKKVFDDKNIKLLWRHNMLNILSVLWVCDKIWVDLQILQDTLTTFNWLPHRLEYIWDYNQIHFYDDAVSATPESTVEAINTFEEKIDTIFLWWTDRGYLFINLVQQIHRYKIKNIVLFPDSWDTIYKLLPPWLNILQTNSMQQAVDFAFKHTKKWKICLLSTASPSYSLWNNFEEKWDEFKIFVKKLSN